MICTAVDDFILDKDQAYWIITLSNGVVVYQDDGRPGLDEYYAWKRLKTVLSFPQHKDLTISEISIRFRSNQQFVYKNEGDGFFWRLKVLGNIAMKKTRQFQLFGIVKDNKIEVKHIRVPELVFDETDVRDITDDCEETLIWNKKKSSRGSRKKKQPPLNS